MAATKEELRENWDRCLHILDAFLAICKKYDLNYQMAYGSVLGTVRHGGFIPWDKNLDVVMPLPDYERFLEVYEKELPDSLILVSYENGMDLGRQIPRIVLKENLDGKRWFNPNLDISVWCGAPRSSFMQNVMLKTAFYNNKLFRLRNVKKQRGFPFNVIKCMLNCIPYSIFTNQFKRILYRYDYCDSLYIIGLETVYAKELFPKEVAEESVQMDFCGRQVNIPKAYDSYLKKIYGNYMTPVVFKKHQ